MAEEESFEPGDALTAEVLETGFWAGGTAGLVHLSCPHALAPSFHDLPLSLGTQTPSQSHNPWKPAAPPRSQHAVSCCKEDEAPGQGQDRVILPAN